MRKEKAFLLREKTMERQIEAALRKVELFKSLAERVTSHWGKESLLLKCFSKHEADGVIVEQNRFNKEAVTLKCIAASNMNDVLVTIKSCGIIPFSVRLLWNGSRHYASEVGYRVPWK